MDKTYLEDSKQRNRKCVEIGSGCLIFKIELTTEELHTEQREYQYEEEEQEEERNDAAHRIEQ